MSAPSLITFTGRIVAGTARGRTIGSPTLNVNLSDVPMSLHEGIYACFVTIDASVSPLPAVMHYGPRPVFAEPLSCEVHLLDLQLPSPPASLTINVIAFIRDVSDFPSKEALREQIQSDIRSARAILHLP